MLDGRAGPPPPSIEAMGPPGLLELPPPPGIEAMGPPGLLETPPPPRIEAIGPPGLPDAGAVGAELPPALLPGDGGMDISGRGETVTVAGEGADTSGSGETVTVGFGPFGEGAAAMAAMVNRYGGS